MHVNPRVSGNASATATEVVWIFWFHQVLSEVGRPILLPHSMLGVQEVPRAIPRVTVPHHHASQRLSWNASSTSGKENVFAKLTAAYEGFWKYLSRQLLQKVFTAPGLQDSGQRLQLCHLAFSFSKRKAFEGVCIL